MKTSLIFTALVLASLTAHAADESTPPNAERGKALHDQFCFECHQTDVYTRENRFVKSFPALVAQVRRCELTLGLQWFDDDIMNTATYINNDFYHFPAENAAP